MKRLGFGVIGTALCLVVAVAAHDGPLGGDQQPEKKQEKPNPGTKDKLKDKDKTKDKIGEKKEQPKLYGTVELTDGSTIQCQFVGPKEMTMQVKDLGLLTIPVAQVRFVDCEGPYNRVSTFGSDLYVGDILTKEFQIKLANSTKDWVLKRDRIKRMNFPDPPPQAERGSEQPRMDPVVPE